LQIRPAPWSGGQTCAAALRRAGNVVGAACAGIGSSTDGWRRIRVESIRLPSKAAVRAAHTDPRITIARGKLPRNCST
jgi:hypothetical protein